MKFKYFLSILLLISITALSGCRSIIFAAIPENSYPFPKGSYIEPEPFEIRDKNVTAEELAAAIEAFPIGEIALPDGSVVSKYEAAGGGDSWLRFDFGFYRIAAPVFGTSFDAPDMIKYDDNGRYSSAVDLRELSGGYGTNCKRVIAGDVLENGLTAAHACCTINKYGELSTEVLFSGEITLSGYLVYEYHPDFDTNSNGTLWLIPDTTNSDVPAYCDNDPRHQYGDQYWGDPMSKDRYLLYSDSCLWRLGNTKSDKYEKLDLEGIFDGKSYAAVTVTIKDPVFARKGAGYPMKSTDTGIMEPYYMLETCVTGEIVQLTVDSKQ